VTRSDVVVHSGGDLLAAAAAARLITALVDAQADHAVASLGLTGGRTGNAVLEHVRSSPALQAVDWSRVDFYWGDERFLPAGHADRNETQNRAALLDHVGVDSARVHVMEPSDGRFGDDPDAAAASYASDIASVVMDVLLLGVGEEGHTASLFPDSPAVHEVSRSVVAVRDCPKPPPTRISLTLPAIRRSRQVWLMTTGEAKADPVARALAGAAPVEIPAAGARGTERTLWLLDSAAAARLS
jgi:6-phosphogluconolactonase